MTMLTTQRFVSTKMPTESTALVAKCILLDILQNQTNQIFSCHRVLCYRKDRDRMAHCEAFSISNARAIPLPNAA